MTGLLIVAAFAGAPFLVWFALTPLVVALDRRRDSPRALALQGAVCGIVLAAAGLPWRGSSSEAFLPEGVGGLFEHAVGAAPGWLLVAIAGAAFGITAGAFLGVRSAILAPTKAPAVAVVWTGIEALLAFCPAGLSPWPGGWLSLGHAIPAVYPEAQLARIAGVIGLSLAIALSSAFLAAGLRADSPRGGRLIRILCLTLAIGIPFACRWTGTATQADTGETLVIAAAVCGPGHDEERILSLVAAMNPSGPSFVVLPALEGSGTPDELERDLGDRVSKRGGTLPLLVARPKSEEFETGSVILGTHVIGYCQGTGGPIKTFVVIPYVTRSSEALVIVGGSSGTPAAARWQRTLDAYRAIEFGRHVIRSGAGAAIHAPSGRMLAGISPRLEGSVSTEIRLSRAMTPYARGGWLLRLALPLCVAGFVWAAMLEGRRRAARRRA